MPETLVERIYEAAFVPDLWTDVLDELVAISGSAASAILVFNPPAPPRFRATRVTHDSLTAFVASGAWTMNPREAVARRRVWSGFIDVADNLSPAQAAEDAVARSLQALGLGWQIGTGIPVPFGQHAVITLERWLGNGAHRPEEIERLDALRPHLARAALMAARLSMERAEAAVSTLEALGLPAAVLTGAGRALAVNGLIERSQDVAPGAFGRLVLTHSAADRLLKEILEADAVADGARSIPFPAQGPRPPGVVHVLPLCGAAYDIMGGAILVVLTTVAANGNVPAADILPGLFDLTPREAQIAESLAGGASLKQAADEAGLRLSTARSYLEQVLRKTGTSQQSQLVALLKGAPQLRPS